MMFIRRFGAAVFIVAVASSASRADSLIEYKGLMMETPAKSWTSGMKQRTEMELPFVGRRVSITRVDKGVVWDLDPKNKTYTERPVAIPYAKDAGRGRDKAPRSPGGPESSPQDTRCTAEVKVLPGTRAIAGLKSAGHRMACKESPSEATVMWVGAPTAATEKVMKEQEAYSKAYSKALFANYPAKERAEMEGGMAALGGLLSQMPRMVSGGKLPKGMWTALEVESAEGTQTFFQLVSVSASPVKADLFEVPAGYRKVENNAAMDWSGVGKSATRSAGEAAGSELKKKAIGGFLKGLRGE